MHKDEFWDWSVKAYANPQTQRACLTLQDSYCQDVNIVLWMCWLAAQGKSPTDTAMNSLQNISMHWQTSLIGGVRKARRDIEENDDNPSATALKTAFLTLELALEKQEQRALEALPSLNALPSLKTPHAACQDNLDRLAHTLKQAKASPQAGWTSTIHALIASIL